MSLFVNWTEREISDFRYRAKVCGMNLSDAEIEEEMKRMFKPYKSSFVSEWDVLRQYEELHIDWLKLTLAWYEDGCPISDNGFATLK